MSELPIEPSSIALIAQILAPGGIAAIAVKAVLNGTKERVKEIHAKVEKIDENLSAIDKRVVRLEVLNDVE